MIKLQKMEYKYLVSIIIPVYQGEEFLSQAISSVINQNSFFKYEIIVLVSKSKDKSLEIALKYQNEYPQIIKVISFLDVCSVNKARLIGVKNASGKYVLFLDADDFLTTNSLKTIYSYANKYNSDITFGSFYVFNNKTKRKFSYPFKCQKLKNNKEKIYQIFTKDFFIRQFITGKLILRSLFFKGKILYLGNKDDLFEDSALLTSLFFYAKKVISIKFNVLNYRKNNKNSLTTIPRTNRTYLHIISFIIQKYFLEINKQDKMLKALKESRFRFYLSLLFDLKKDIENGLDKKKKKILLDFYFDNANFNKKVDLCNSQIKKEINRTYLSLNDISDIF